jgi:hypothetical protein
MPTFRPTSAPPTTKPTSSPTYAPVIFPSCKKGALPAIYDKASVCIAYKSVLRDFKAISIADPIQLSSFYGAIVRIVWHDAGEADVNSDDLAGPDGCLAYQMNNAGLYEADSPIMVYLEPMFQKICNRISRADFWVMVGKLALEKMTANGLFIRYQFGRTDRTSCMDGGGRLPSPQGNLQTLQDVFVDRLGLTMTDAGTLHCQSYLY